MNTAPDFSMIREEIAANLSRVAAHAAAGACHVETGSDRLLAAEMRCCAASLLSASQLIEHLNPARQAAGERAA